VPDALALVYDCLPSKEDRRSLLHSCRAIHSLPQVRAKVGDRGWVFWLGYLDSGQALPDHGNQELLHPLNVNAYAAAGAQDHGARRRGLAGADPLP